ncbi:Protein PafC [Austwickia sp. TVS 96-490-7B]|uniref:helix-turn-helix transcriptional regulator n=1 Tax=Austwickia sp. TVS 96-490-7B TaxID=2830843 RepID=UPI001C570857|nr:WYL domain-containing protein [Austwickia sp. TVS 96-490-7B]MBW3085404.1 Protein PafC [Austwickia sp. TVS 96-490-7B]
MTIGEGPAGRSTSARSRQESASDRLARLLTMVPWLLNRPGIAIEDAAAQLQVSPEQVESDLELLFLCGMPGGMPDDLIEADWHDGRIYLGNADTIARPLRLGREEALALIVALRTLAQIPGLAERDALDRTLAKLEEAASMDAAASVDAARHRIRVQIGAEEQQDTMDRLREALARRRRVHVRYLVAARDESTERDVDPMRLTSVDGRWYLEGWCHRSEAVRLFRVDRVESVEILDVDGTPPVQAQGRDLGSGAFQAGANDVVVTMELSPSAAWVAEWCPHVGHVVHDQGSTLLVPTSDMGWLRRLVWQLGGQAQVTAPQWVADQVLAGAEEALAGYREQIDIH